VSVRALVVLSRPDCGLCSDLLELLAPYAAAGIVAVEHVDLADQPLAMRKRHQWRIPVVFDGETELMWGRIDSDEVVRVLGPVPAA